jgi:hypothetical protein
MQEISIWCKKHIIEKTWSSPSIEKVSLKAGPWVAAWSGFPHCRLHQDILHHHQNLRFLGTAKLHLRLRNLQEIAPPAIVSNPSARSNSHLIRRCSFAVPRNLKFWWWCRISWWSRQCGNPLHAATHGPALRLTFSMDGDDHVFSMMCFLHQMLISCITNECPTCFRRFV